MSIKKTDLSSALSEIAQAEGGYDKLKNDHYFGITQGAIDTYNETYPNNPITSRAGNLTSSEFKKILIANYLKPSGLYGPVFLNDPKTFTMFADFLFTQGTGGGHLQQIQDVINETDHTHLTLIEVTINKKKYEKRKELSAADIKAINNMTPQQRKEFQTSLGNTELSDRLTQMQLNLEYIDQIGWFSRAAKFIPKSEVANSLLNTGSQYLTLLNNTPETVIEQTGSKRSQLISKYTNDMKKILKEDHSNKILWWNGTSYQLIPHS